MVSEVANIYQKLARFIKKYYTNELIKGCILFVSFGLLYLLLTLSLEYFFWLNKLGRMLLFWFFLLIEFALLGWFVARPLLAFFKLKRGLNHEQAAKIIGRHFSEVSDKLINLLQLSSISEKDELLLAGIEQKANELKPVPFQLAINFKENVRYLRYIVLPLLIFLAIVLSGKFDFFDSYQRVVHYQTAYSPPPPFEYLILNDKLSTVQNEDYQLMVKVIGSVLPSDISIVLENQTYLLKQTGIDTYTYHFLRPQNDINFRLTSNGYSSKEYILKTIDAPSMLQIKMSFDYPRYTKKQDETILNAGNVTIPEGTVVRWNIITKSTSNIMFVNRQDSVSFERNNDLFVLTQKVLNSSHYSLISSNIYLKYHEKLDYQIDVVKDEYPNIHVKQWVDSIHTQNVFFMGEATDDYALKNLRMGYYPSADKSQIKYLNVPIQNNALTRFTVSFPDMLPLIPGQTYDLFFEVYDNDGVNGSKKTVSEVFSFFKLTQTDETSESLNKQKEVMRKINKTSSVLDQIDKQMEDLNKLQKTKEKLSWNEQQQLKNIIERQKQQEKMMKIFSEELLKNLQNNKDENNEMQQTLKDRLESNKREAEQNEKLLEELQRISDKLSQTELNDRIEKLSNQSKSRKKSLQQLLELTKRFYVTQKLQNLTNQLDQLSEKQYKLSETFEKQNNTKPQETLNLEFDNFKKELQDLIKENGGLKKPIQINRDQIAEKQISKDQQQALKLLTDQKQNEAKPQQKSAADKMRALSESMQQNMSAGQGEQLQEDLEVLRQILDNLVSFSFMQEKLFDMISTSGQYAKSLSSSIKAQYALRENFQHIDDSLFSLSLRRPEFSEVINKEIQNVYENIDKSLSQLSEYENYKAAASQQYTLTSTNKLADFLSDILDNIQEQMSSSSSGSQGKDFQLPDIIKQQQAINDAMQQKMNDQNGKPNDAGKEGDKGDKEGVKNGEQKGKQGGQLGQSTHQGNEGNSELDYESILQIYRQQQSLKFHLEDLIKREGLTPPNTNLLKQADQIEQEFLLKGFNSETLSKMINFKHQLLKLEEAVNQQEDDKKRKADTNTKDFSPTDIIPLELKHYFQEVEILNRQALPLRPIYKNKVNRYFISANDTLQ